MIEENKKQNLEKLYVSDELKEFVIEGIVFKIKVLSGLQYSEIHDEIGSDPLNPSSFKSSTFIRELLKRSIVEPKNINFERIKPNILLELSTRIQDGMNIPEEVENLKLG